MAKKLKYEDIKQAFEKEEYELLEEEYLGSNVKMKYKCPQGHIHEMCWDNFKQGKRCPECYGNIKLTIEYVKSKFEERGYVLLAKEYIDAQSKMDYVCPNGHRHSMSWDNFKKGVNCPYCVGKAKHNIEYIREKFKEEGYTLLTTEYKDNKQSLDYICPNGHKHHINWAKFQQGQRCPYCNIYKGEEEVSNILDKYNIDYKTQYTFEDCKYKNKLKFDFYIPSLNICIEFDGDQHYKPIDYFGGEKRFKIQQICDQIKNDYCKENNITLIRIPYIEYKNKNIENILKQELNLE